MVELFSEGAASRGGVLICCSSHEDRCLGLPRLFESWRPRAVILFHYMEENNRREILHKEIVRACFENDIRVTEVRIDESRIAQSLRENRSKISTTLSRFGPEVTLDISVLTRQHLFLMLNWLFDCGHGASLYICYTEPEAYLVGKHMPLSFGVRTIDSVPGFPASAAMSRPLHLIMLLGSEGARAKAVYEQLQPMKTSLLVVHPPSLEELHDAADRFNRPLIQAVGREAIHKVSGLDPLAVVAKLRELHSPDGAIFGEHSTAICALGTKAQAVGVFLFARWATDSPALLYASPLRHNQAFYSKGIGSSYIVFRPGDEV